MPIDFVNLLSVESKATNAFSVILVFTLTVARTVGATARVWCGKLALVATTSGRRPISCACAIIMNPLPGRYHSYVTATLRPSSALAGQRLALRLRLGLSSLGASVAIDGGEAGDDKSGRERATKAKQKKATAAGGRGMPAYDGAPRGQQ